MSKAGKWTEMGELITDEVLDTFAVIAPPEQIAARIAERFGDVVDRLSFSAPYQQDPDRWNAVMSDLKAI